MLDIPFFLFSRVRFAYKAVFLTWVTLFSLICSVSFASFLPIYEDANELFAELCAIDEESPLEDVVASLIDLRNSLLEQGYSCPSLTDLCLRVYNYLSAQGIEIDLVQFQGLYEEIERQECATTLKMSGNLGLGYQIQLVKHPKSDKKEKKKAQLNSKTVCGLVKCLAGGLLCIIPVPAVQIAGAGLVMTGVNDCIDGSREQGDENERQQQMDEQRRRENQELSSS
jgi:hypothetical protein